MKNLKKKALMAGSYLAVAAIAVGGTMAYFTDQTDPITNVRTVGDVEIVQHEYQRADGGSHINTGAVKGDLVPFEQGQMIMPAVPANGLATDYSAEQANDRQFWWGEYTNGVGSNGLWDDSKLSNVMDKFVFVENTGDSAAYYRTIIAFECPDGVTYGEAAQGADFMINTNGNARFTWDGWDLVDINGTQYAVTTAIYNEALEAGEISRPSLLQIVMTHNADNEVAEALGDTYEVLVMSQAVQADSNIAKIEDNDERGVAVNAMLDEAFGEVNADNVKAWFDGVEYPVLVDSAEELEAALAEGGNITLTEDIELVNRLVIEKDVSATINLNGKDLILPDGDSINNYGTMVKGSLTIEGNGNVTVQGTYGIGTPTSGGDLTINGGTYTSTGTYMIGCFGGTVTINGGTFNGNYCILNNFDGYTGTVVVNDGTFSITNDLGDETAAEFLGDVIDNR